MCCSSATKSLGHGLLRYIGAALLTIASARADIVLASYEYAAPECTVSIEKHQGTTDVYFRVRLEPGCEVSLPSAQAALQTVIPQVLEPANAEFSLFLGRLVEYPWLSTTLADAALQSPEWNGKRGRMRSHPNRINAFVMEILRANKDLQSILPDWEINSISVEKVLVGPTEKYAPQATRSGKAPFDAMCWLRYRRRHSPASIQ